MSSGPLVKSDWKLCAEDRGRHNMRELLKGLEWLRPWGQLQGTWLKERPEQERAARHAWRNAALREAWRAWAQRTPRQSGRGGGVPVRETGPERQRGNCRFCLEVEAAEN